MVNINFIAPTVDPRASEFHQWRPVPGFGQHVVERPAKVPTKVWVWNGGPKELEVTEVQRIYFAHDRPPFHPYKVENYEYHTIYTDWSDNIDIGYRDYIPLPSTRVDITTQLSQVCDLDRTELCHKVVKIMDACITQGTAELVAAQKKLDAARGAITKATRVIMDIQ
jgi:hypothetical protein